MPGELSTQENTNGIKTYVHFGRYDVKNMGTLSTKDFIVEYKKVSTESDGKSEKGFTISPNLKDFFIKIKKIAENNSDFEDNFGKEWKLVISSSPYSINVNNKILNLNTDEFIKFHQEHFLPAKRDLAIYNASIAGERKPKNQTIKKLFKYLQNDRVFNSIIDKNSENEPKKLITKIVEKIDNKRATEISIEVNTKIIEKVIHDLDIIRKEKYSEISKIYDFRTLKNKKMTQKEKICEKFIMKYYKLFYPLFTEVTNRAKYNEKIFDNIKSGEPDIVAVDDYGVPILIEIKLPTSILFDWDDSHKKFYPNSELSSALSQINNYIRAMKKANIEYKELSKMDPTYSALSYGILIIGDISVKNISKRSLKNAKNHLDDDSIINYMKLELLTIQHSNPYIKINTYEDLKRRLELPLESKE